MATTLLVWWLHSFFLRWHSHLFSIRIQNFETPSKTNSKQFFFLFRDFIRSFQVLNGIEWGSCAKTSPIDVNDLGEMVEILDLALFYRLGLEDSKSLHHGGWRNGRALLGAPRDGLHPAKGVLCV